MRVKGLLIVGLLLALSNTATTSDKRLAARDAAKKMPKTTESKQEAKASDAKELLLPTIVNGKQESPAMAVEMYRIGVNKPGGKFKSQAEADAFAKKRSNELGILSK